MCVCFFYLICDFRMSESILNEEFIERGRKANVTRTRYTSIFMSFRTKQILVLKKFQITFDCHIEQRYFASNRPIENQKNHKNLFFIEQTTREHTLRLNDASKVRFSAPS